MLCDAIAKAEELRKKQAPKVPSLAAKLEYQKAQKIKAREGYNELKIEYDLLMTDSLNVLRRKFELETGAVKRKYSKLIPRSDSI